MIKTDKNQKRIDSYGFEEGRVLAGKYKVISHLGTGWEGEVYKIQEIGTEIDRTAKIFFPKRNVRNKTANINAQKLHQLRECPIVIKYHTQETITFRKTPVTILISEYVEGEILTEYLKRMPGKRLHVFQGIHLLHALATGVECIHHHGEYHGDLHTDNIIVRRVGLSYELKFIDLFHWGKAKRENMNDDICDIIRVFYDAIGGQKWYNKHPKEVKDICYGLKRSLILKKFRTAADLRMHLETQAWK
jgi:tRNA A-37 threonylcarbamoyl transferase component Bud32